MLSECVRLVSGSERFETRPFAIRVYQRIELDGDSDGA